MNAKDAAALAALYAELIADQERYIARITSFARDYFDIQINAALTGTPAVIPDEMLSAINGTRREVRHDLLFTGQDAATRRLWGRHRIVYAVDPDLWAELGEGDPDDTIPPELFARMPHPDPFVVFPEPLDLPIGPGQFQRIGGFFLRGDVDSPYRADDGRRIGMQASTADARTGRLGLLFIGPVHTTDGRLYRHPDGTRDVVFTRITLDPHAGRGRIGNMIDTTLGRFHSDGLSGNWRNHVPLMVRRAVSLLVYLCTVDADIQPAPRAAVTGRRPGAGGPKPAKVLTVGYRVGRALRAYRAREQEDRAAAVATGRTVAPHVRRAHFHTYRTGKGRTERVVKWLPPIPVNVHGPATQPTVIPVNSK